MGREVRHVPPDWQHPKTKEGWHKPLYKYDYEETLAEWEIGKKHWDKGEIRTYEDFSPKGWEPKENKYLSMSYEEYAGERPKKEDYMPTWKPEECTHYQMYEDVTEGTPISPVMETPEELAQWLVDNDAGMFGYRTATYEEWLRVCQGEWMHSGMIIVRESA